MSVLDGVLSNQYSANLGACINPRFINENGWHFVDHLSKTGSNTVRELQKLIGAGVDGVLGPDTIRNLQAFLGLTADGILGYNTVVGLQRWVNAA